MQIEKHKVVSIEYTLTDDAGTVIDSSKGQDPLAYIQGIGNIIPGLESALEGKATGDSLQVAIAPRDGYGERDDALTHAVPRERFEGAGEITVGMRFQTQTPEGMQVVTVTDVNDEHITIDTNHPLAGMTLNFDVTVMDVRDATEEEISHGHAHGAGGHEH